MAITNLKYKWFRKSTIILKTDRICFLCENLLHWLAEHKGDKSNNDQNDDVQTDEDHGKEETITHSISFK